MLTFEIGAAMTWTITDEQLAALQAHPDVMGHVIKIGFKNILQDCHASAVRDDFQSDKEWRDAKLAMVGKKFDAMLAGELRSNSSGPRASKADPIQAEALRLARIIVYPAAKAKGVTDKEKIAQAIAGYAARADVVAQAQLNVEAKAALVATADDLGL